MPILLDRHSKCWHLPIFPRRFHLSIFGTTELNFRVRYGNGWTLSVINTNFGDSWGTRTPVAAVRGRSLNRLTNEPFLLSDIVLMLRLSLYIYNTRFKFVLFIYFTCLLSNTYSIHIYIVYATRSTRLFLCLVHHQGLEPGTP